MAAITDYKKTLQLPTTAFPMKANLPEREPLILEQWEKQALYQTLRERNASLPIFTLHDGPPYANGHIHMGTTVNKVLKDMVVKSKTLSGFNATFVPGWDCHGLPIELNVEKKIGKAGVKVSASDFRRACREYAKEYVDIQRTAFKRLGVMADWEHPYLTMDFTFEANVVRSLSKIVENGHLQRGLKPVHWCLDCASALAEAEVEYINKNSHAIDVRFRVIHHEDFLSRFSQPLACAGPISIPIWTTTSWTLPANQAVALNEDIDYVLVECSANHFPTQKEYLLIAEDLLEPTMKRYGCEYHRLAKAKGHVFQGVPLQHPFYDQSVPVILGEHVTVESGTGAVHTAPAHGLDDYRMGQRYALPMENPVADNGCYTQNTPLLAGLHVTKSHSVIMDLLNEKNALLHHETITHSYPHCWRHKTPLIFRTTPQWFISMEQGQLRDKALHAIDDVEWIPTIGKNRIASMIENRPDWCISRQRTWGVPIPVFTHQETGELHPNTHQLMNQIADQIEKEGVDAWFELDIQSVLGVDAAHYTPCRDILDVWFDSGVTHECVIRHRSAMHFPADLYLEGSDQHRGWFQSSLLTSLAMNGVAPYKTVLTHGYVIDLEGRKMSKSLGNVIAPETIIQASGADVLRLWVASIDYRNEIYVSDEILQRTAETYRRLRNTARFLLANTADFDPIQDQVPMDQLLAIDRFALDHVKTLQADLLNDYEHYQFHMIYQKIHRFCSVEMGGFYLDILKDRLYTTPQKGLARRSAQTALFHILEALVRWLAPILSFTAEEIWQQMPGQREESVFFTTWYSGVSNMPSPALDATYWEIIRSVRDVVNKALEQERQLGKLGSALEADVRLYCEPALKMQLDALGQELRFVLITSQAHVEFADQRGRDSIATEYPGLWLSIHASSFPKCERCWHRCEEIGHHTAHPTICDRCIENISGEGEKRQYA